jgi:uridylate kinase
MVEPIYRRILLKLSGEALEGSQEHGIDPQTLDKVAVQIAEVCQLGAQIGVVVGGGNIFRGLAGAASGMNRSVADGMGMLATVVNCLAMGDALRRCGQPASVFSAFPIGSMTEPFSHRRAKAALEAGEVVLLGAGTGNPYFTTDTAAALRALEIDANALLKATKVDGVYDKDPKQHEDAIRFECISYDEVLERRLGVMDLTAITLCRDNDLPLLVFDMTQSGNIKRVVLGEPIATRVTAN